MITHLGRELHRRYDEFGPILVFDDGNKRYLSFGTADEQSCQLNSAPLQLQHEYARAMAAVLVQFSDAALPTQITLLGTGGGTLAAALHHVLPPGADSGGGFTCSGFAGGVPVFFPAARPTFNYPPAAMPRIFYVRPKRPVVIF